MPAHSGTILKAIFGLVVCSITLCLVCLSLACLIFFWIPLSTVYAELPLLLLCITFFFSLVVILILTFVSITSKRVKGDPYSSSGRIICVHFFVCVGLWIMSVVAVLPPWGVRALVAIILDSVSVSSMVHQLIAISAVGVVIVAEIIIAVIAFRAKVVLEQKGVLKLPWYLQDPKVRTVVRRRELEENLINEGETSEALPDVL